MKPAAPRPSLSAIAAVALLMVASVARASGTVQIVEAIVVNVNGDILTRRELDERVRGILMLKTGRPLNQAEIRLDPTLAAEASAATPQAVADAIDEILVLQRGRELGLEVTDDDVDRVLERMRRDGNATSEEAFTALLVSQGIPTDAFRESVRRQIGIEQVRQEIWRHVRVTDAEAESYYQRARDQFQAVPTVTFREILVALPSRHGGSLSRDTETAYDQGLIRFVKAQDRVTRGEAFADVARELSDATSKDQGGAVGPVDPRTLPEAVRVALAQLAVGQISPPVRTEDGYRLLQLEAVSPARPATFAAFRDEVVAQLLARRRAAAFNAEMHRLRAGAVMVWKDKTLERVYVDYRSKS